MLRGLSTEVPHLNIHWILLHNLNFFFIIIHIFKKKSYVNYIMSII